MGVTVRFCRCDSRYKAESDRSFVFDPSSRSYVMPEAPLRVMTERAKYFAFSERKEFPHVDHSGEQVRYYTCPFCGGDLPGVELEPPRLPDRACGDGPESVE